MNIPRSLIILVLSVACGGYAAAESLEDRITTWRKTAIEENLAYIASGRTTPARQINAVRCQFQAVIILAKAGKDASDDYARSIAFLGDLNTFNRDWKNQFPDKATLIAQLKEKAEKVMASDPWGGGGGGGSSVGTVPARVFGDGGGGVGPMPPQ